MDVVGVVEAVARMVMPREPGHGWDHVERVRALSRIIAEELGGGVDTEVLDIAAILHDVGRALSPENHAEASARFAERLLRALGYPEDRIGRVVEAIRSHSFSSGRRPRSIEAAILSDADKLDALGAVGIARVFMYSGAHGRGIEESIRHFYEKILKLPSLMLTKPGRRMAEERVRIVKLFLEELEKELRDLSRGSRGSLGGGDAPGAEAR